MVLHSDSDRCTLTAIDALRWRSMNSNEKRSKISGDAWKWTHFEHHLYSCIPLITPGVEIVLCYNKAKICNLKLQHFFFFVFRNMFILSWRLQTCIYIFSFGMEIFYGWGSIKHLCRRNERCNVSICNLHCLCMAYTLMECGCILCKMSYVHKKSFDILW